jgi:hypothetical protein
MSGPMKSILRCSSCLELITKDARTHIITHILSADYTAVYYFKSIPGHSKEGMFHPSAVTMWPSLTGCDYPLEPYESVR